MPYFNKDGVKIFFPMYIYVSKATHLQWIQKYLRIKINISTKWNNIYIISFIFIIYFRYFSQNFISFLLI